MSHGPISCPQCGIKISASRSRCPRCRTVIAGEPAAPASGGKVYITATAVIVALFLVVLAYLWYANDAPGVVRASAAAQSPSATASAVLEPQFVGGETPSAGVDRQQARRHFEGVLSRSPRDGDAAGSLGRIQLQLGDPTAAVASFHVAVEAAPERWQHRFNLAQAQCGLNRWDECIGSLRDAQRAAPAEHAVAHNLGVALHRRGVDDVAVEAYLKARELAPGSAATLLGLAISYDKIGRVNDAVNTYGEFLRLDDSSALAGLVRTRTKQLGETS